MPTPGNNITNYLRVKTAFNSLKSTIFGGKPIDNFDLRINRAITRISKQRTNKDILNQSETLRSVMTKGLNSSSFDHNLMLNFLQNQEVITRYSRYINAEELCYSIPQCARALSVLSNSIISPDTITKDSIQILGSELDSELEKKAISDLKSIRKVLEIDDLIGDIISDTLKLGDQFIEICDYKSGEVPITQSLLTEQRIRKNNGNHTELNIAELTKPVEITRHVLKENGEYEEKKQKIKITIVEDVEKPLSEDDQRILKEANNDLGSTDQKMAKPLINVRLIKHDPRRVIKIQSIKYKLNLGYLVIPGNTMFLSGVGTPTIPGYQTSASTVTGSLAVDYNAIYGMDDMYLQTMKIIKKYIEDNSEDLSIEKDELIILLKNAIKDMDNNNIQEIKFRYVPPERMQHFYLNLTPNFPYGESIFQRIMFGGKLLIALEAAVTMKRVTDSSEKRIIYLEANAPRNIRTVMTDMQEAFKRRKYSVDTMANVASIPSMITSFEDIYLPMHNGKKYVEFDMLAPAVNVQQATDDLKYFRDKILSGLDVPAAFLNVEENLSNKSILAHESSMFAETILAYQKVFSKHLKSMFSNIYKFVFQELLPKEIQITFPAPKSLQMEKTAENMEVLQRIVQAGQGLKIPEDYLINKYVDKDEEEIDNIMARAILKPASLDQILQQQQSGGMGGGMDMGGGMGGPEPPQGPPPPQGQQGPPPPGGQPMQESYARKIQTRGSLTQAESRLREQLHKKLGHKPVD